RAVDLGVLDGGQRGVQRRFHGWRGGRHAAHATSGLWDHRDKPPRAWPLEARGSLALPAGARLPYGRPDAVQVGVERGRLVQFGLARRRPLELLALFLAVELVPPVRGFVQ